MNNINRLRTLGLMSGTSLDGVDIALIETDGVDIFDYGRAYTVPYEEELSEQIRSILGLKPDTEENALKISLIENKLTSFHAEVVKEFISSEEEPVDLIGFHGHTIFHEPENHYTHQIGDGQLLADLTRIRVVNRFRNADVVAGGQGAPLVPIFHAALCAKMEKPVAVLNIGGVSNITWIGANGEMMAFDTGPGNAPVNDWVRKHAGLHMDYNGKLAISGKINEPILANLMKHKYFAKYPPKSIDRNIFNEKLEHLEGLSLEDGAATATAFTAEAVAYSMSFFLPIEPKRLIVCGGGANNPTMVRFIRQRLPKNIEVLTAREVDWNSDAIEAQAFAYLAARRLVNLPITFPSTTGAPIPLAGGVIHEPSALQSERVKSKNKQ